MLPGMSGEDEGNADHCEKPVSSGGGGGSSSSSCSSDSFHEVEQRSTCREVRGA